MIRSNRIITAGMIAIAGLLLGSVTSILAVPPNNIANFNQWTTVQNCTYQIFTDGINIYSKHCDTGTIAFTGTSATTVLQQTFNAIPSQGGKVFVKAGNYTITSALNMNSNTSLECESWSAWFVSQSGSMVVLRNTDWTNGNHDIAVRNCAFDGRNGENQDGTITFENVDRLIVEGVQSINAPAEGIKTRFSNEVLLRGNLVNRTAFVGGDSGRACINAASGSGYVVMTDNICINAAGEAYGVYRSINDKIVVADNVGIVTTSSIPYRGHILIESDVGTGRIPEQVTVTGNTIVSNYYGINVISGKGLVIANNALQSFNSTSLDGIHISGSDPFYISITGNVIRDYGNSGIYIEDSARRGTVTGNTIINPSAAGVGLYDGITLRPAGGSVREWTVVGNTIDDDRGVPQMRHAIMLNVTLQQINELNISSNVFKGFTASKAIGYTFANVSNSQINTSYIRGNVGYSPDKITAPFDSTNNRVGLQTRGTIVQTSTPVASKAYDATLTDLIIWSTGGTGVSITVRDTSNTNIITGATNMTALYVPRGWDINFGGFSAPPTVTIVGVG